jgi:hypothetical protein
VTARRWLEIALLGALTATASCRQLAGIQELPKPCSDPLMIDDMEDGDPYICRTDGRYGGWFGFGDGSASGNQTLAPSAIIPGGRGASRRAMHFTGSGFSTWGALAGFNFNNSDGLDPHAYVASSAGGFTFWMKASVPVTVEVSIEATTLVADGGACDDSMSPNNCNDHFAFQITKTDSTWKQYQVPYAALRQSATGTATWDPSTLFGLQFAVGPGADFDVWIDDIAFYHCATPECVPTCNDPKLPTACAKAGAHGAGCFPPHTMCSAIDTWCADPMMLDDMEDGDSQICRTQGRQGGWYSYGDAKAQFEIAQIPGGRGASNMAAHLTGTALTDWGAGMGFGLNASARETYDASADGGITFWMKATGGVSVNFRTPETTPVANPPGTCTNAADCDHHFGYGIYAPANDWVEYHVPFSALSQPDGGSGSLTWDPTRLLAIEFAMSGPDLELWVDDIRFYNCTGDACVPTCNTPESPLACPASPTHISACWPAGSDCANPPDRSYTAVWGSSSADVWIVGATGTAGMFGPGVMAHWDGASWTSGSTSTPAIWAIWGSDADNAWMAGQAGTMRRRVGSDWVAASGGTTNTLYQGMWGSGPSDVWAAGIMGTMVHYDGSGWTAAQSPTTQDLWGLWTSSPAEGWAVGVGGTTLRLTASGWSPVASGTSLQLDGVWGNTPDDVWAVGQTGTILHWNGSAWAAFASGTTKYIDGVWGSGPNDVWAVGEAGTILRWNGSAWTNQPSGTTSYLDAVWGTGPDDIYVVGYFSTILHWDGQTLSPITIPVTP